MSIVRTSLKGRRSGLRGRRAHMNGIIDARFRGLGYYTAADYAPDTYSPSTSPFYASNPVAAVSSLAPSSIYGTSAVPGSISPQEAALLSQAISSAGQVGQQAIIGTPQVTYNPLTGQYTATGGAALPTGAIEASSIGTAFTEYLPYILIGGALILVVSMAGKR